MSDKLCPCGWKRPVHVLARYPKGETPSSVELGLQCPNCNAWHVAIIAKDQESFERARRDLEARG